jgi:hypothetical protein
MPDFLSERISLSEWQSFLPNPELANTARGLKGDVAIIESVTVPHNLTIGDQFASMLRFGAKRFQSYICRIHRSSRMI